MEVLPVAIWILACGLLAISGWPLAAPLFAGFPDRGAALSLPVALALLGMIVFWVGHLSITLGIAAGLALLVVGAFLAVRYRRARGGEFGVPMPAVEAALVWLLAFGFVIAIRAVDPAVHPGGGEKFLDFGLLNSLVRGSRLPPEDVWFAGEPVQYYYGGHLIAAVLTRLTGVAPRFAYNLSLATFYATVVTGAYGLAGAIAARYDSPRRLGAAFGAVLLGLGANLVTVLYAVLTVLPDSIAAPTASAVAGRSALSVDALDRPLGEYSYWTASRVIEGTVNEFPLFSWVNGDLHAHMMSTPFLVLVAAIGYAYVRSRPTDRRRRRWLVFGALPPVVGLLAIVNVWSFPTAAGLTWLVLTFGSAHPGTLLPTRLADRTIIEGRTLTRELSRTSVALGLAFCVLALGFVWSAPFWIESASASGRTIGFGPERSTLTGMLLVYGIFLAVFVPYLLDRVRPSIDDGLLTVVGLVVVFVLALVAGAPAVGLFGPLLVLAWLLGRGQDLLIPAVTNEGKRLLTSGGHDQNGGSDIGTTTATTRETLLGADRRTPKPRSGSGALGDVGYETVLLIAGFGLIVLVEFVFLDEGAGPGRYNTVFKTYMQVWVLFSIAAGAIGARLCARDGVGRQVGLTRRRAAGLLAVLVCLSSLYAGVVLTDHMSDPELAGSDGPTLDALAFVDATHPEEAAAIDWLDRTTAGRQPTMVSAPGTDIYRWVNAPSSLTGVPTVAGWSHEVGYRGSAAYNTRVEDVDRIFTGSPAEQARLLRQYEVRYVYVGPVERERYGEALDLSGVSGLTVAYRSDGVRIYTVERVSLGSASN